MSAEEQSAGSASLPIRIITGVVFLALGIGSVMGLSVFKEKPKTTHPRLLAPMVAVEEAKKKNHQLVVRLNGTIEAMKESQIIAQVSGKVKKVEAVFVDGGVVKEEGKLLLTIDDADYQSAKAGANAEITRINAQVAQLKALKAQADVGVDTAKLNKDQAIASKAVDETSVVKAKATLDQAKRLVVQAKAAQELETSQREIAIAEWKEYAAKTGKEPSAIPPLVAREPQRKDAAARVASAEAGVLSAQAGKLSAENVVLRSNKTIAVAEGGIVSARKQVEVAIENIKVAEAQLESAKVALAMADLNIERCSVRAPYAGSLTEAMVHEGQFVTMGQALTHLVSLDKVQARLPVAKDQIAYLNLDIDSTSTGGIKPMKFVLETTIGEHRVKVDATVTRISPVVDRRSRAYELFAEVINRAPDGTRPNKVFVLPGTFVSVKVEGKEFPNVYQINRAALRSRAPRAIEEKYPNADAFIAYAKPNEPAEIEAIRLKREAEIAKREEAKESASDADGKAESKEEPLDDDQRVDGESPGDKDNWSNNWIDFIPVKVKRKEGDLVLIEEFNPGEEYKIQGKRIITSSMDLMTVNMKVRVESKKVAKVEKSDEGDLAKTSSKK